MQQLAIGETRWVLKGPRRFFGVFIRTGFRHRTAGSTLLDD
jgi:hypothetical protein